MRRFPRQAQAPEPRFCRGGAVPRASRGARLCKRSCSLFLGIWRLKNGIFLWQSKSSQGNRLASMFMETFSWG